MKSTSALSVLTFLAAILLSGCATAQFSVVEKDVYQFYKMSDACAVGVPTSVLNHLKQEAVKFCAGRKEYPFEIESSTEMGIPAIRCTSAKIKFRCSSEPNAKS